MQWKLMADFFAGAPIFWRKEKLSRVEYSKGSGDRFSCSSIL